MLSGCGAADASGMESYSAMLVLVRAELEGRVRTAD